MRPGFAQKHIERMLQDTGITLNGPEPWDPAILNPSFFRRVLVNGSLGLGESYVDGWWECDQLDEFMNRILGNRVEEQRIFIKHVISGVLAALLNLQKRSRAFQVGKEHYDIGNDLYRCMLDRRMVYTCGYWAHADNLDDAQRDKLDLVCRKLSVREGMRILDIGCGWGSFAKYAAETYGARVVGVTVSREQVELGTEHCRGLPVELRLQDYREVDEKFDAIVSLGMFEHVGHKNYRTYMNVVRRCLKKGALCLLHTIGKNDSRPGVDPWIGKYIFPNGEIPSLKQIAQSMEPLMHVEDLHNFGPDYDRTLMAWNHNFNRHWNSLKEQYDERFFRVWNYYLKVCAGAFRARNLQLWQIVIANGPSSGVYRRPM